MDRLSSFCGARTNVTSPWPLRHKDRRHTYRIMIAGVFFGGFEARLRVLRAYDFFNHSNWAETLGRMGSSRSK